MGHGIPSYGYTLPDRGDILEVRIATFRSPRQKQIASRIALLPVPLGPTILVCAPIGQINHGSMLWYSFTALVTLSRDNSMHSE